jgi:hypothetical protein
MNTLYLVICQDQHGVHLAGPEVYRSPDGMDKRLLEMASNGIIEPGTTFVAVIDLDTDTLETTTRWLSEDDLWRLYYATHRVDGPETIRDVIAKYERLMLVSGQEIVDDLRTVLRKGKM